MEVEQRIGMANWDDITEFLSKAVEGKFVFFPFASSIFPLLFFSTIARLNGGVSCELHLSSFFCAYNPSFFMRWVPATGGLQQPKVGIHQNANRKDAENLSKRTI